MPDTVPPSLDDVKRLVLAMSLKDRAAIRPWILARIDVRGYVLDRGVPLPHQDEDASELKSTTPDS
jgi:hypothetical protein